MCLQRGHDHKMSKSESIAEMTIFQVVARAAASMHCATPVSVPERNLGPVRRLPPHSGMRINRKCPECVVGMGLARRAMIGLTNRLVVFLWCQACLHEWEVEEEPSAPPAGRDRKDS